eukprot:scaffold2627_cov140-Amphora_coffeaeformis.AAC.2
MDYVDDAKYACMSFVNDTKFACIAGRLTLQKHLWTARKRALCWNDVLNGKPASRRTMVFHGWRTHRA